ncbi:hypothetical protein Metme_2770 [Methylomonas methanica MC09]|uniref:Uncharacterized protein n=1 Tax=Methylomonas methanica (strain DSM 25384 / MC09) TaxID=857087 RepID=G0A013_METMM|nr:hypothetical protein Metme_2770 [Methylomonas methanica MC09]
MLHPLAAVTAPTASIPDAEIEAVTVTAPPLVSKPMGYLSPVTILSEEELAMKAGCSIYCTRSASSSINPRCGYIPEVSGL